MDLRCLGIILGAQAQFRVCSGLALERWAHLSRSSIMDLTCLGILLFTQASLRAFWVAPRIQPQPGSLWAFFVRRRGT